MKIKQYTIVLIVASILFAGCSKKETIGSTNEPTIKVTVNAPTATNNPLLAASGKIEAVNSANLSTRMMGFVTKVYVNVGQKVTKGQLLLAINNADLQAKRAQINAGIIEATAAFTNAEKDYKRFQVLFTENSASQKEMDDMTARYQMAKARLEAAKQMKNEIEAQFAYVNITAPFNGIVTNTFVEAGDMANPGIPLVAVEAPGAFEVKAMVPESEISSITNGVKVSVLVKSINTQITGTVTEVSSSAKNTGGQYLVKVTLDSSDSSVRSGMYATVRFPVERKNAPDKVLIPTSSIIKKGELSGIYTISQQNTALLRWLRLGRTYGDQIEVLAGLNADETYIVTAEGKLFNGAKVAIQ